MMSRRNPYKLFDYYTEADADVFFGREREVSAVLGDILANKLLVLFAASGSGKTSLLNAGIGPALREIGQADETDPGIRMITIRLAGDVPPEESALRAIKAELREAGEDDETLHQLLRRLCAIPKPDLAEKNPGLSKPPLGLVLVFDQFEELFISLFKDQPETRREFGVKLAEIIHDETLRAYVVLSLRSDHFHHLNEFRSLIPSIFQHNTNLELRPFDLQAALRIIRGPADRPGSGFSWEPGVPERIVQDLEKLSDERGRVLPIHLQIVCYDLFEILTTEEDTISLAHYESRANTASRASGSPPAEAMIRRRIIEPLQAIKGRERRRWLYRLLRELMTAVGAKFPRSLTGLSSVVPARYLPTLLEHLEKRLLVRRIVAESETYYELRHDFLARRISPWLQARENELRASDRRRRSVVIGVAILLTGLITKLWIDWSTFTAHLGFDPRPDELRLERKAPFGMSAPSWWKRNIFTGYTRSQLLAAGLKQHLFAVERPLTNWKEVGDQLNPQDRWLLQLASRLETEADEPGGAEATLFEAIQHPDAEMLALADERIFDLVLSGLKLGDLKAKRSAAEALGRLGDDVPTERSDTVVEALLAALKERDSGIKESVFLALGSLSDKLPPERVGIIVEALLEGLHESEPALKESAANALGTVGKKLPTQRIATLVRALLADLKEQDNDTRSWAHHALDTLIETLPPVLADPVVEVLLAALKEQNNSIQVSAANALSNLAEKLPPEHASTVIEALRGLLEEKNLNVRISAAEALGNFGDKLSPELLGTVVKILSPALKERNDLLVASRATLPLINLGKKLSPERVGAFVEILLATLNDEDSHFKARVTRVLTELASKIPEEHVDVVVEALLSALRKDSSFEIATVDALGTFGRALSAERVSQIVEAILPGLKAEDSFVKNSVAEALGKLAEKLPAGRVDVVVEALVILLNQEGRLDKRSAAEALGSLGKRLPAEHVGTVVESLLAFMSRKDLSPDGKSQSTLGLNNFVEKLPPEHVDRVAEALLTALNEQNLFVKSSVAAALGIMGDKLPLKRVGPVGEALLAPLKEEDADARESAAQALRMLAKRLPAERIDTVSQALRDALKEQDSQVKIWAAPTLAILGARSAPSGAPSFFAELDALPSLTFKYPYETRERRRSFLASLRFLASAKWPQTNAELLTWLESDDGRWRSFALHVLARRQPLKPEVVDRVVLLRNDPKGRPWVRLAALRCLVEIEREKDARRNDVAKNPN